MEKAKFFRCDPGRKAMILLDGVIAIAAVRRGGGHTMGSVLRAGGKLTAAVHPVATPALLREMEWPSPELLALFLRSVLGFCLLTSPGSRQ
jgi:hypothetical protein